MSRWSDPAVRVWRWVFSPYSESHHRRQVGVAAVGSLLATVGLLAYAMLLPELPFAETHTSSIGDARAGDLVKVYGSIECECLIAINWSEEQVGLGLSKSNWSAVPFSVRDPSGEFTVDTDSLGTLKPGVHGGDYWQGDFTAVFGHVYDQGNGALAVRAEFIAPRVDDTLARFAWAFVLCAALGGVLIAAALADRWLFGSVTS